jgi:hypothetical protein
MIPATRTCTKCLKEKSIINFHKHKKCKNGINSVCKDCRKPLSSQNYKNESIEYKLWYRAKRRAKLGNIKFNIEISDIIVPKKCPVFKKILKPNTAYSASLDKIDPKKGYVKGNIQVISTKANTLKNDASLKELNMFADWIKTLN